MNLDHDNAAGLKLVTLGFVAVIAIAGLVLMFTQTSTITGNAGRSGIQKLSTEGLIERSPYEACRAVHTGSEHGMVYVWNGMIKPRNNLIACVDPLDPTNEARVRWVELNLKYG